MSEEQVEKIVLEAVKEKGPISPRKLEATVRDDTGAHQARVALQRLLNKGELRVDDNLDVVAGE